MKILAFLQNPWFEPDTSPRLIELYRTSVDYHRRILHLSPTGRALHKAFGRELYELIIWDNANPAHGSKPGHREPPNVGHMMVKLCETRPDLVLCFGRQARAGMEKLMATPWSNVLFAPHPMARGSVNVHLVEIVREVKERYATHQAKQGISAIRR